MTLRNRWLAAALACSALVASPAAALAQSAGDGQYADPLSGNAPSKGSGNSSNSSKSQPSQGSNSSGSTQQSLSATGSGTTSGQTATQSTTTQGATTSAGQLPRTGLDTWLVAVVGAGLVGIGLVLRRTAAHRLG